MATTEAVSPAAENVLGTELRRLRQLHALTLKDIERSTGISNAYLSQVETGRIEKPSPDKLYKLAELYQVSYDHLMQTAGYIVEKQTDQHRSLAGAAMSTLQGLTPEEEEALAEYLTFLRFRKGKLG
ncbi:helix-turn-helix transcriptional regulator (plasmid) [Deinococcus sp. D7000]|nr:helix-turn-helix transcriptional regulator [Deinococcus sp. D7000]